MNSENDQNKRLVLLVGLPYSGKTFWAQAQNLPIVSPDAIRLALHGHRFLARAEPQVWAIARYMVHSLFIAGHKRVILDATTITKARRDEWKSQFWARDFYEFPTDEVTCIERAVRAHDTDIQAVIHEMAAKRDLISPEELSPGDSILQAVGVGR